MNKKKWYDIVEITSAITFLNKKFPESNLVQMDELIDLLEGCLSLIHI